jgi:hypothetical protein
MKNSYLALAVAGLAGAITCLAGDTGNTGARDGFVQVSLERKEGNVWKAMDPRVVLNNGDRIRFKFETSYPGFLYVYNKSTDGSTEKLFPAAAGSDNRVAPGKPYMIPSGDGSFIIDGPPGFDVSYWIVSPEPLPRIPMFDDAPKVANLPSTLIPRCKEGLVARGGSGGCLDERAGPQAVQNPGKIVPKGESTLKARSIRPDGETKIAAPASKQAPLVYEFRIAHGSTGEKK